MLPNARKWLMPVVAVLALAILFDLSAVERGLTAAVQTIRGSVSIIAGTITTITNAVTVTQPTGTNLHVVCDSGCTAGGSTGDNTAFTFGTTALNPSGFVFDDTSPNAVTENRVATPRMSANRVPYGILRDGAGNERGANVNASNELLTSANTELPTAVQSTTTGQTAPTAPFVNAVLHCQDLGAITISPCIAADNTAHDAVDAGNPLKLGARAVSTLSALTPVAAADRTNLFADLDGVLLTRPHAPLGDRINPAPVSITDGSSTAVVAAQGAGIRFCATTIIIANTSATGASVDIRDGTAGAVKLTVPAAANFGGGVISLPVPVCGTANTIMAADPSAAVTSIVVSILGFNTKL